MRWNKNKTAIFQPAMKALTAVSLLCFSTNSQTKSPAHRTDKFDYAKQIGIVSFAAEQVPCLDIANTSLQAGDKITLIAPGKPQRTGQASIVKKLGKNCPSRADEADPNESHYEIKLSQGSFAAPAVAFAVAKSTAAFAAKAGLTNADLDGDGQVESFRECTSQEGVHFTVWTGKPLQGKRRWHYYYYLGYDVEPNCKGNEAREP
ncbi:MAG: hypothetical protein HOP19_00570 [Acidobacteria bacterium]|nr:hypothetical protein [Acidobacteriota bacterium]